MYYMYGTKKIDVVKLVFGFCIGYLVYMVVICPPPSKKSPICLNQICCGEVNIHIHHWIIHIILLLLYLSRKKYNVNFIIIGLLLSGIIHGIFEYDDWSHIVKQAHKEYLS